MALGSAWARLIRGSGSAARPLVSKEARPSPRPRSALRQLCVAASWAPVLFFVADNVVELTPVSGPSMSPFLNERYNETLARDVVLTWKLYAERDLARGMVVTFWNPMHPELKNIKRITGLPGDVVRTRPPFPGGTARVPAGHVWVEGDAGDRGLSVDSNDYGPISARLVTGRVVGVVWPPWKAGLVRWWEWTGPVCGRGRGRR